MSYGIYLFHWPIYLWFTPDRLGFGGAGLAASGSRPDARIYDLFADLCPDGRFEELTVDGELVRPDGVHLGDDSANWWARLHAAEVLGS